LLDQRRERLAGFAPFVSLLKDYLHITQEDRVFEVGHGRRRRRRRGGGRGRGGQKEDEEDEALDVAVVVVGVLPSMV